MAFFCEKIASKLEEKRSNKDEVRKTYINHETGEVTEKSVWVDRIFDYNKGYILYPQNQYIKTFQDSRLPNAFSWTERGRIHELKHYIIEQNQLLGYRSKGFKPLNIEKMAEIFNTGERQTKELVKKMKDYSIIKEVSIDGEIWYAFNPIYGLKGKRITNTIFIIFQKELMPILPYHIINKFLGQLENVQQNIRIIE